METTKQWRVDIQLDEHDGKTHAKARMHSSSSGSLVGFGSARCNPSDLDIPEIGEELAAARALADLAHLLLDATVNDIDDVTHTHAEIHL